MKYNIVLVYLNIEKCSNEKIVFSFKVSFIIFQVNYPNLHLLIWRFGLLRRKTYPLITMPGDMMRWNVGLT